MGLVLGIAMPVHLWRLGNRLRRRTACTTGEIVGYEAHDATGSETPRTTWHARVQFAAGQRTVEFVSAYGNSWSRPQRGQRVDVRYDSREPQNADVDRGQSAALGNVAAIACAVTGLVLLAAAVGGV